MVGSPFLNFKRHFVLSLLLLAVLFFPFATLLRQAQEVQITWNTQLFKVIMFTLQQAFLSSAASLVFGVLGALGLSWIRISWSPRWVKWAEGMILLPNVVPVLLILLVTMKLFPWAIGLKGVTLVHALMNVGLVSVAVHRLVWTKMGGMAELALIEGASRRQFLFKGVLPYLRNDLLLLFLFVFALCMSSFAVPLMVGGSQGTTIETLIYQKIRLQTNWREALGLSFMQVAIVCFLAWTLGKTPRSSIQSARPVGMTLVSAPLALILALFAPVLVIYGMVSDVAVGWERVRALHGLLAILIDVVLASFVIAMSVGFCTILLLATISFVYPQGVLRKILLGYVAPSSVLMGFALLIACPQFGVWTVVKIILGVSVISIASFYRMQWDSLLHGLEGQRVVAQLMGASDYMIWKRIVWPQIAPQAFFIGGLASIWAWGDISLSSVVAERSITLSLVIKSLMGTYRLDAATFLIWILLLGGAVTFLFFYGGSRVLDHEFEN